MAPSAVILAAGRGSRLNPLTADRPKCLTELGGQSLIGRQLRTLNAAGIGDVTVVGGYRAEMLKPIAARLVVNDRWRTTNMVESLFAAEARFTDDMIVAYGDIVYEPRVLHALLESRYEISVVVDRAWRAYWQFRFADPLADAESLRMDGNGRIADIGRKVSDIDAVEAQYIGLMRFKGDGVATLRNARAGLGRIERPWMTDRPVEQAFMTDLLMEMILTGANVRAVAIDGGWLEIDTIADYDKAAAMIASGDKRFFDPDAVRSAA